MSDMAKELEKIILKAGIDGALTEDAVSQFHSLVKERDALKQSLKESQANEERLDQRVTEVNQKYSEAVSSNDAWASREADLKDREEKCTRLEIEKECAEKRVNDHQKMVELIFRNAVVRRGIPTPGYPSAFDQYGNEKYGEPSTVHDTTEEET